MFGVCVPERPWKVFDGLCVGVREVCLEKWRRRAPNWTIKQTVGTSMTSLAQQRVPNRVNSTPGEFWNLKISGKVSSFHSTRTGQAMEEKPSAPPLPPILPRQLQPIVAPQQPQLRSSRSFADWVILVAAFIFLVIISHAADRTVEELQKLTATATLKPASPQTFPRSPQPSPPPYPGNVPYPPPSPPAYPSSAAQPRYEYLVESFIVSCYVAPHYSSNCASLDGFINREPGAREYADFLNNKSAEGWELFQSINEDGLANVNRDCIFRRVVQ